jgi:hypothetical protein
MANVVVLSISEISLAWSVVLSINNLSDLFFNSGVALLIGAMLLSKSPALGLDCAQALTAKQPSAKPHRQITICGINSFDVVLVWAQVLMAYSVALKLPEQIKGVCRAHRLR